MAENQDCCGPDQGHQRVDVPDAIAHMLAAITPIAEIETIPLAWALGRVVASPVISQIQVPGWDNSAMDGYAIRHSDLRAVNGRLPIAQRIPAGSAAAPLAPGTAARIFTGAPVPEGADTVVLQEVCERSDDAVVVPLDCQPGANIRRAGEDIDAGAQILAAGTRLGPQHIALVASTGVGELQVYRRLRVALLTTGDELVEPGIRLEPGQIYNSNRFMLAALLQGLGCDVVNLGKVADTFEATTAALSRAAAASDLIIASGGVSVGEEDHLRPAVQQLGRLDLWRVAMRPGKPVAFGFVGDTPFFGAPGNPVSLFVTFCLFARQLILRLQGAAGDLNPRRMSLRAGFDWPKPDRRTEFHRARTELGADGTPELSVFPSRSSGALSSVTWADGLVEINPGQTIRKGDIVDYIPFNELLNQDVANGVWT